MGIYDRDYYRNEGPSFLGSYVGAGRMCMWLVAINAVVFIAQIATYEPAKHERVFRDDYGNVIVERPPAYGPVTEWLSMKPREAFQGGQIWRFVTGAFLHSPGSIWHIFWNMLFLWIFGRDLEDLYGRWEFLAFYLVAGTLANVFWGVTALWRAPDELHLPMALGASGAVMAVMVLCALHFPHRVIYVMFVLPIPYWLFVLILVGLDLNAFLGHLESGVAVAAHLGGAAFGALYWRLQLRLLDLGGLFVAKARRTSQPRLRAYREEPVATPAAPQARIDPSLARQADAILEKISRQGKESLTPEERDVLQRASEEFRKRRR